MSSHRRRHSNCKCDCCCCCNIHPCCDRCPTSCCTGFTNRNCNSNFGCDCGNNQWLIWLVLLGCGGFGGFGNNCCRRGLFW